MHRFRGASKWVALLLAVALIIPLASCVGEGETAPTATPTPTPMPTLTPTPSLGASTYTGTISSLNGDVVVQAGGSSAWIDAVSGMEIGVGDSLKTGSDGYAMVIFHDGSVMEVEADSEVRIEELSVAADTGSTTVRIMHVVGKVIHRVENLVDSVSIYVVETPAGSAVAQGTFFESLAHLLGLSCITCLEDCVEFTAHGVAVWVCDGERSCAWPGSPPCPPWLIDPAADYLNYPSVGGPPSVVINGDQRNGVY